MTRRAWTLVRAIGLALAVAILSPVSPMVLVALPLAVLLLAFHSRRLLALILAAVLLGLVFSSASGSTTPMWFAERAWALLVAGGFVAAGLVARKSGALVRSLIAVSLAFAVVAVAGGLRPELLRELDWWVTSQIERAALVAYQWIGGAGSSWRGLDTAVQTVVDLQSILYPALLALSSIAALGIAWYAVERLAGSLALGPLREFRFSDQLVWLLVVGLLLFLLPVGEAAERLGGNAMAFMGGLYLLRGIAILVWLVAALVATAWGAAFWALVALLLYPVAVGAALVMGLSDTWLDLRRRLSPAEEPE